MSCDTGLKTKERVKKGELHPNAALHELTRDPLCPQSILKWVDTVGRKRYNDAMKKQRILEQDKEEANEKYSTSMGRSLQKAGERTTLGSRR